MNKLLHANFSRLFRSKIFRIGCALMVIYPIFAILSQYFDAKAYGYIAWLEESLWVSSAFLAFICGVLVPTFIGSEYSDKTIRNKLIVGHTKAKIYFSNMITMLTAAVIMSLIWNIVYFSFGSVFLPFANPMSRDLVCCLESLIACLLLTALLVMTAMFVSSKSASAVLGLSMVLVLLFFGIWVKTKLSQEEYIEAYRLSATGSILEDEGENDTDSPNDAGATISFDDASGSSIISWDEMVKNPDYIPEGTERDVLTTLMNISAGAQIIDTEGDHDIGLLWFILFDPAMILVISVGGAYIFKKKDIS